MLTKPFTQHFATYDYRRNTTTELLTGSVRRARPEWDDDKVRRAAEYLVLYMDVRLKPYKVNEKLNEFDKDGGFLF